MRLIDADALVNKLIEIGNRNGEHEFITQTLLWHLDRAPTASKWIPVTEEPIPDGEYLVTWTSEIQEEPILSIVCRYSEVWDCWELQLLGHHDINILAYMPLPEPYKGVTT